MDGIDQTNSQQIHQNVRITAKELAAKFSTKREVFNFLTIDCRAYLPDYNTVTIVSPWWCHYHPIQLITYFDSFFLQYFLKDLIAGNKKFLKDH